MVMKTRTGGLLIYKLVESNPEVLLAHMGGPYHANKDKGHWSIPKGEIEAGENAWQTAKREFEEELGIPAPHGKYLDLGLIEQKNNKTVRVWATEADLDLSEFKSNKFKMEWPPKSGKIQEFPEIDKAEWFNLAAATEKIIPSQVEFLKRLAAELKVPF